MLNHSLNSKSRSIKVATLLTLLCTALAGTLIVNFATADPVYIMPSRIISVTSPVNNKMYTVNTIALTFVIPKMDSWGSMKISQVQYSLDGKLQSVAGYTLAEPFSVTLPTLTEGTHDLQVLAKASFTPISNHVEAPWDTIYSSQIHFTVDTLVPRVSFLSAQGAAYTGAEVSFNFTVNELVSWIGYSLDGNTVLTVTDDVASTRWLGVDNYQLVLNGLPAGAHSLTVYAEDSAGHRGATEPFSFTVTQSTQETPSDTEQASKPFLTTTTAVASAIIASAAVIAFGLVAYFVRRNRKSSAT